MQRSAYNARTAAEVGSEHDSVVVHVQLRPRRGATRRCLAALAALAAEHDTVAFGVTGLSKDDRIVRVTVGVDLGPRAGVARFSPQAQAAYAFVSAVFTSLYDHMPVYTAEPSAAERAAAVTLLDAVAGGTATVADLPDVASSDGGPAGAHRVPAAAVPGARATGYEERIPA
jgi:hypothetical protein